MRIRSASVGSLGVAVLLILAPVAGAEPPPPGPLPSDPGAAPDAAAPAAADAGVPHLASPEHLPPGSTSTPPPASEGRGLTYLRELWHAVQTQDVSGADALLLLTQRPMNPDANSPRGLPAGPQVPPAP
jgi:hypothetical protein